MTSGYDVGQSTNASIILAQPMLMISSASGGTQLPNQACNEVTVQNITGNALMFIGGISDQAPFSGKGYQLYGGNSLQRRIDNFNKISACATTSGQLLCVIGTG